RSSSSFSCTICDSRFLDITVLLPTIAILALTKEIRNEVKQFLFRMLLCCNKSRQMTSVSTTKIQPSTKSVSVSA
ncbi:hypothetical protein PENTCL1PPCAC_5108, partial [Pristionchus entomophagus]